MPVLCLGYEVHEPYQLRRYTVFDMGQNSIYEDDDRNCDAVLRAARLCYLPANDVLLRLIRRHGEAFKIAFSISGTALDQFEQYAPEVLDSFKALADTGCVEFVAETSAHSLAFLYSREEFIRQVKEHAARLKALFGQKPGAFVNTACVYNNDLAQAVQSMGFKAVLAEGADHVLGWRSANWLYRPAGAPRLRLFLRNTSLSGDMGLRFCDQSWKEWPLTAEKFASWCHDHADTADIINIFDDYHIFGLRYSQDSGIFDFLEALPAALLKDKRFSFTTPSAAAAALKPVGEVDVPQFMSWEDEGRDLTAWLGNDMQKDAIHGLYSLAPRVRKLRDKALERDFQRLQTADHFYHISTKWFAHAAADRPNPFGSPYDAYITYMNVLADFEMRLDAAEKAVRKRTVRAKPEAGAEETASAPKASADAAKSTAEKKPAGTEKPGTPKRPAAKGTARVAPKAPAPKTGAAPKTATSGKKTKKSS